VPAKNQKSFLESIDPKRHFDLLLAHLPGVSFFVKNAQGRFMRANTLFLERFGFKEESAILGKTDAELFPSRLAENFRRDDKQVMSTGEPMLNIVELFFNRQGIPDWYITNKLPLYSQANKIIGVMGTVQSYESNKRILQPYFQIDKAVDFIKEHFREQISIRDLAAMVNLSVRQFDRKFKDTFNSTPQAFIIKMRIQAACDELRRDRTEISEIAVNLGFYDQSSFTLQFRRHMGITPLKYRQRFRLGERS
jgi:PAS domain S-box-containing protein